MPLLVGRQGKYEKAVSLYSQSLGIFLWFKRGPNRSTETVRLIDEMEALEGREKQQVSHGTAELGRGEERGRPLTFLALAERARGSRALLPPLVLLVTKCAVPLSAHPLPVAAQRAPLSLPSPSPAPCGGSILPPAPPLCSLFPPDGSSDPPPPAPPSLTLCLKTLPP